ncbi:hypothetical protein [Mycobacterium sp. E2238]|uniref:hypothetical protein n=1 Tax=Mycobacterium sp. E2238 TaxID=1834131 RepID=UPI0018D44155|nr:hypothetical protein [Mycobacterium sp. E2238]
MMRRLALILIAAMWTISALISALRDGASPFQAGRRASTAASATVQRLGGRPDLSGLGG